MGRILLVIDPSIFSSANVFFRDGNVAPRFWNWFLIFSKCLQVFDSGQSWEQVLRFPGVKITTAGAHKIIFEIKSFSLQTRTFDFKVYIWMFEFVFVSTGQYKMCFCDSSRGACTGNAHFNIEIGTYNFQNFNLNFAFYFLVWQRIMFQFLSKIQSDLNQSSKFDLHILARSVADVIFSFKTQNRKSR